MKSGYIYVLVHPSYPDLYKIGVTERTINERLKEHNTDFTQYTGKVVEDTGRTWRIVEFHKVPDIYNAENNFWWASPYADLPGRQGIEVQKFSSEEVQKGLEAALRAGVNPKTEKEVPDLYYAYTARVKKRLEGRGIKLIGLVRSIVSGKAEFECDNGHTWRTWCRHVAIEGQGCEVCGMGETTKEKIEQAIKKGTLNLMTHPEKPELVRFEISYGDEHWDGWEVQHVRNIDETELAEKAIWGLLDCKQPKGNTIKMEFIKAKGALKELDSELKKKLARMEKQK